MKDSSVSTSGTATARVGSQCTRVRGMRHGRHGYHPQHCGCWECSRCLHGQVLFYKWSTGRCADDLEELHEWVTEALQSWLDTGGRDRRNGEMDLSERVCVMGAEVERKQTRRRRGRVGGPDDRYTYCFMVALPREVRWTRLWEKLLCKKGQEDRGLSLQQVDSRTNKLVTLVWKRDMRNPCFRRYFNRCWKRFVQRPNRREFGSLSASREVLRRWAAVERDVDGIRALKRRS